MAQGGSAGGMLMGAVSNMAPDLFKGIVAEVPFVDVLSTMLDDTLPLTPPEWPEWGNPIKDKTAYEAIAAYSPYDRVEAKAYPNILAVGGLTDPRVTYWEPAKWVARLRELKTNDNLLLFKTNMGAGHGGASGRFRQVERGGLRLCLRDEGGGAHLIPLRLDAFITSGADMRVAVFVDAGYVYAQGSCALTGLKTPKSREQLILDESEIAKALKEEAKTSSGKELLRIYWYDGAPSSGPSVGQARMGKLNDVEVASGPA